MGCDGGQGLLVAAAEPVGLAAGDAEVRPLELIETLTDGVQRRPRISCAGTDLVEAVDEQSPVVPLRTRSRIERDEVPRRDHRRRVAERGALVLELGRLASSGVAEQHVRGHVPEVAERLCLHDLAGVVSGPDLGARAMDSGTHVASNQ